MKISNTILAVFQLRNEISAIAANNFIANLDYLFYICGPSPLTVSTFGQKQADINKFYRNEDKVILS
jgi:hypothetical protein